MKYMKTYNSKSGVSMIVLMITMLIMITLIGITVANISDENPVTHSKETSFKNEVQNLKYDLQLYINNQEMNNIGYFDVTTLSANKDSIALNGNIDTEKNIKDVLPNISDKYIELFEIQDGLLYYIGTDVNEKTWATNLGVSIK